MRALSRSRRPMVLAGLLALVIGLLTGPAAADFSSADHPTDTGKALEGTDSDLGGKPRAVAAADFNGDGQDDLAAATNEDHGPESEWRFHTGVSVALSQPDGSYAAPVYYPLGFELRTYHHDPVPCCEYPRIGEDDAVDLAAADVNGDTLPDLVAVSADTDGLSVLINTGGTFAASVTYPINDVTDFPDSPEPVAVATGDLDGDGDTDLVTANKNTDNVSVLLNTGAATGTGLYVKDSHGRYAIGSNSFSPEAVATGDVDGDGDQDVVTANLSDDVSVLLNTGNSLGATSANLGNATAYAIDDGSSNPVGIALADLDGNAGLGVVTANQGSDDVSVLVNDGSGDLLGLESNSPYAVGTKPADVALADVDSDNDKVADYLASANEGSDDVSVLVNDGSGGFSAETNSPYSVGAHPVSIAVGDLDLPNTVGESDPTNSVGQNPGDLDPDLVTANQGSESWTVLHNQNGGSTSTASTDTTIDRPQLGPSTTH